jgi:hypothetical protein
MMDISEIKITNVDIPKKTPDMKSAMTNQKNYFLDPDIPKPERKNAMKQILSDHNTPENPSTSMVFKAYSNKKRTGPVFYKRYLFPGFEHRIQFEIRDAGTNKLIYKWPQD